jgi:hypothetical protein
MVVTCEIRFDLYMGTVLPQHLGTKRVDGADDRIKPNLEGVRTLASIAAEADLPLRTRSAGCNITEKMNSVRCHRSDPH